MLFALILMAAQLALAQDSIAVWGKVTDGATHLPVERARIDLRIAGKMFTAFSADDGSYAVDSLPATRGTVTVSKAGYIRLGGLLPPDLKEIDLSDAKTAHDFAPTPGSTISGQVLDADTEKPIAQISVLPFAVSMESGKKRLNPGLMQGMTMGVADANGHFAISGVAPGSYVLQFVPMVLRKFEAGPAADGPLLKEYEPLFFPESASPDGALPVNVAAGEHRTLTVRLRKKELPRLVGSVEVIGDVPRFVNVNIVHQAYSGLREATAHGTLDGAGEFHVDGVPEGDYVALATGIGESGRKMFARTTVRLTPRSMPEMKLILQPALTIEGTLRMEDDGNPLPAGLKLRLTGLESVPTQQFVADADEKGSFRIEGVEPGAYRAFVNGLPKGYAPIQPIVDIRQSRLDVKITSKLGAIFGKAEPNTHLTLSIEDIEIEGAQADEKGSFSFTNLAPGRYQLNGKPVEVQAGQATGLTLPDK